MALGVEELGRQQVGVQVLVLDLEARDPRGAGELAVDERGVEVGDGAAERRDAMYWTSNATLEWTVSAWQVPVGTAVCVWVVVLIVLPPLRS